MSGYKDVKFNESVAELAAMCFQLVAPDGKTLLTGQTGHVRVSARGGTDMGGGSPVLQATNASPTVLDVRPGKFANGQIVNITGETVLTNINGRFKVTNYSAGTGAGGNDQIQLADFTGTAINGNGVYAGLASAGIIEQDSVNAFVEWIPYLYRVVLDSATELAQNGYGQFWVPENPGVWLPVPLQGFKVTPNDPLAQNSSTQDIATQTFTYRAQQELENGVNYAQLDTRLAAFIGGSAYLSDAAGAANPTGGYVTYTAMGNESQIRMIVQLQTVPAGGTPQSGRHNAAFTDTPT